MTKRRRHTSHDCPVVACPNTRQWWEAVCRTCWSRLPEDIRGRIESARASKARHRESEAAIEAAAWLNQHSPAALAARRLGEDYSQAEVL